MPGITTFAGARVLQGLVLQSLLGNSDVLAEYEKQRLVSRHEMCHGPAFPHVPVQPEATIHGVDHSITTPLEFAVAWYFRDLPY
jgi:hypothetical protein